jgi:hypothetical protein
MAATFRLHRLEGMSLGSRLPRERLHEGVPFELRQLLALSKLQNHYSWHYRK